MPQISVLMSVLNGEKYLAEAIDSILVQTFTDFEFLIMDDGSSDSTPHILHEYAKKDSRIRLFRHDTRQGVAISSNELLQNAQTPWIARLDADDIALQHRLEAQWHFVQNHPNTVLLGGGAQDIDYEGHILPHIWMPYDGTARSAWELCFANNFPHSTTLYRHDLAIQAGGYEIQRFGEEFRLWVSFIGHGELHSLQEVLIYYRIHDASATALHMSENTSTGFTLSYKRLNQLLGDSIPQDMLKELRQLWLRQEMPNARHVEKISMLFQKLLVSIANEVGIYKEHHFERDVAKRLIYLYIKWAWHSFQSLDMGGTLRILAATVQWTWRFLRG